MTILQGAEDLAFSFTLSNSSGVPYYRQIVNQVIFGVANGMLKPGERLPTVRQLAVDLQINLNTIAKAYSELEIRGVVNTQQGTGTFVSEGNTEFHPQEKQIEIERICSRFLDEISAMGLNSKEVISTLNKIVQERTKLPKGEK